MITATTVAGVRRELSGLRGPGGYLGLVPTMGGLHEGHLSLVKAAKDANDIAVVSIYVNPTQFGDPEDLKTYPRDLKSDVDLAAAAGADLVFAPSDDQMYPPGRPAPSIEPGPIANTAEGRFRPGHFAAVATVCVKLFNITGPDRAYFGEKDAQQLRVIEIVAGGLDFPIEIVSCPTVRHPDGLAMSSRNRNLSPEHRRAAPVIARALGRAAALAAQQATAAAVRRLVEEEMAAEPLVELEYVSVVDPRSFEETGEIKDGVLIQAAATAGGVRLLDCIRVKLNH